MNDYEAFLRMKTDRDHSLRRMRNALLVQELREIEKAQSQRPRFHFRIQIRLPRLSSLRLHLRRQTPRVSTPLNAH